MSDLDVQYDAVGRVARDWDEERHHLGAAAAQLADADLGVLRPAVAEAALVLRSAWAPALDRLRADAEQRADGLRDCLRDYLASDERSMLSSLLLTGLLQEQR